MIQLFQNRRKEQQRVDAPVRAAGRRRRRIAFLTATTVALSGIGIGAAGPAVAAPLTQQIWDFTNENGEDWYVPNGVNTVLVGLRGGAGGYTDILNNGRGADFAVEIPVSGGDKLTVFPGKPSPGRKGGKGWINGGDGGTGSLSGADGGGGGGAAAVFLNGELVAVAGGGGGGGGYSGHPSVSLSLWGLLSILEAIGGYSGQSDAGGTFTYVPGGKGASSGSSSRDGRTVEMWAAEWGAGPHASKPGENGRDDSNFAGYHKNGTKGSSAATSTSGGGGGGGGGGWPASGTGGGAGRKFLSYSAGSGGGTGMSWVNTDLRGIRIATDARRPEDMHDYFGPLAEPGAVRIMIPVTSTTRITAPATVEAGQPIPLRVRTADTRTPNSPLDGWLNVYQGNTRVDYAGTGGDRTFTIPGLSAGTYVFRAEFEPRTSQRDFRASSTRSQDTVTVTVVEPAPPGPSEVASSTTIDIGTAPTAYGEMLSAEVEVQADGAVDISGESVSVEVDGEVVGTGTLVAAGDDTYRTEVPVLHTPHAGDHSVVARFDGVEDEDPDTVDVLASVSDAVSFSVARAATTTAITQAPLSVRAFGKSDVAATVTAGATPVAGQVVLHADGVPLEYGTADSDGQALFEDVVLPWGTEELTVAFLGDDDGDYAASTSAPHAVTVTEVATHTTLSISSTGIRADEPVTISATVTNALLGIDTDPRGSLEILFDGEVAHSIPAGMDCDPDAEDGEARFELAPDTLPVGSHQVSARFVPGAGFGASASDTAELEVRGIPTAVAARKATVSGTTAQPVTIEIDATVAADSARATTLRGADLSAMPGEPLDGHIEAYLGADPIGAAEVVSGEGTLSLSGLSAGTHSVRLQFVPESAEMLGSSAEVTVIVTTAGDDADSGGGDGADDGHGGSDDEGRDDGGSDDGGRDGGRLPETGAEPTPGLWAIALILIVGGTVIVAGARRRAAGTGKP